MKTPEHTPHNLLEFDIPTLHQAQLDLVRRDNLYATEVGGLDVAEALDTLQRCAGQQVIGIDIGGDKLMVQEYKATEQGLVEVPDGYKDFAQDKRGSGYVAKLQQAASYAQAHDVAVGMSIGMPVENGKPADPRKLPALQTDLQAYDSDFCELIPSMKACLNDGPAGLISGAIHANVLAQREVNEVLYLINGGGMNTAVLHEGKLIAMEAGHTVGVADELDRYNVRRACGVFGLQHTCIELVASSGEGIEQIWHDQTGEQASGLDIERHVLANGEHARLGMDLYEYSAFMAAHLIQGVANSFEIDLTEPSAAVVGHGGAFKFPDYGTRIQQVLNQADNGNVKLLMTHTYSRNACMDGAALAAIIS